MSNKTVFVILWLSFPLLLLAQAPERTKPTTTASEETKPCWEQVMKTMADGSACFGIFIKELDKQKNNPIILEELELAGVRFLKANGYTDEEAASLVTREIKKVSPVTEVSKQTKSAEEKATPAVLEETPIQKELVDRTNSPTARSLESRRTDEEDRPRQKGWKDGLPSPEEKSGYCWEGRTNPGDLFDCIAQLEQYINQVREDKSLPSEGRQLAVKNLKIYLKKLEKLQKSAEKGINTQRTWARSRAIAGVGEVCPQMWVHEGYAGRGWSGGLGRITLRFINNTGVMIERVVLSNGNIIEKICPGASVTIFLTTQGSRQADFLISVETPAYEGGVRKLLTWSRNYNLYADSQSREEKWELVLPNRQNSLY